MNQFNETNKGSFPPWTRIPSFEEMADEAGIDGAEFLDYIKNGYSAQKIAEKLKISDNTAECLYNHFFQYGVGSVIGGD